jgi:hypothetical protein
MGVLGHLDLGHPVAGGGPHGVFLDRPLGPHQAPGVLAVVVLVILLTPAIIITALLIAAIFAMPVLVSHVARRDYP